jgi:hypothetical protein
MTVNETFQAHLWQEPPESYQGKVPFIVSDLIQQLINLKAEKVEGIFRLNGSDRLTKELIEDLDKQRITNWSKYHNVHTIATALKRYFRAMATVEPIIPFRLYNECIDIGKSMQDENYAIQRIRGVVKRLDIGRYNTLSYLIKYLHFITEHSNENMMTPKNVAVCFGPNIITSDRPDSTDAFNDSVLVVNVLDIMITHYAEIFDNKDTIDRCLCDDEDITALTMPPLKWVHVANLIARTRERCKYKGIPFVPAANMQMGILMNRPKRTPPPILAETDDEFATIHNGFADFYGDAVGAQNTVILAKQIQLPAPVEIVEEEEAKLGFDQIVEQTPEPEVKRPVLSENELYIPPEETVIIRKSGKKGRKPPKRR